MPNKTTQNPNPQQSRLNPQGDVGRDTDGDGRVVQPGHRAGEIDGAQQRRAQSGSDRANTDRADYVGKDTDGDGRVVQPGHRPGQIDGGGQKQKH